MELPAGFLPLLGTWTGLERLAGEPHPEATTARASLALRLEVGGTAVVGDYRQVRADGEERTAHAVYRATAPEEVTCWLFTSTDHAPTVLRGAFTDEALELTAPDRRHRLTGVADDLELEVTERTADGWRRTLTGRYRRLSGH